MDMFMDKLAQKLTAQEIIKANTAAETEELNRLRNQIVEYNECLTKLQKLIDEGAEKLQAFQTGNAETDCLMEQSIEKAENTLRQDVSELGRHLAELDKRFDERLAGMDKSVEERLDASNKPVLDALTGMENSLQEKLRQFGDILEEKTDEQLAEKLSAIDENVHKECVKVYRNVQAVILAENEKQREAISESDTMAANISRKVGAVLKVSVAALVFSILGIVLQVLGMLNLLPF